MPTYRHCLSINMCTFLSAKKTGFLLHGDRVCAPAHLRALRLSGAQTLTFASSKRVSAGAFATFDPLNIRCVDVPADIQVN